MDDRTLLTILIVLSVIAFGLGIWAGLGYPGLYRKHEKTGRASRLSPFEMLMDRLFRRFDQ